MSEETAEETPTTPREPIKIGPLTPTGPRSATVGAGGLGLVAVRQPLVLDALRLARAVADADAASDTEGYLAVRAAAVGVCLVSRPLEIEAFADHGRDVARYGEHVADALIRGRLLAPLPWSDPRVTVAVRELGDLLIGWVLDALTADAAEADRVAAGFTPPAKVAPASAGTR